MRGIPKAGRIVGALLALSALWIALDLWLRLDLPGAPAVEHALFRALVGPLAWLGAGERLGLAGLLTAALLLPAWALSWGVVLDAAGALLAAMLGLFCLLALLLEPALGPGLALAAVLAWRGVRAPRAPRGAAILGLLGGAGAASYAWSMVRTWPQGYPLVQAAGRWLRAGGPSFPMAWSVACAVFALGMAGGLRRRLDLRRLGLSLGGGLGVTVLLGALVGGGTSLGSAAITLAAGLGVVAMGRGLRGASPRPRSWPAWAALPTLLAAVLVGHAYFDRVLRCPPLDAPFLRRIGATGEVFDIQRRGDLLALSLREDRRFARLDLGEGGRLEDVDAGPMRARRPEDDPDRGALQATPEELTWAGDRFFASVLPADAAELLPRGAPWGASARNAIVTLDADARRVTSAFTVPDLCWISALRWEPEDGLLYTGCEDRSGLRRLRGGEVVDGSSDPRLGDVQDLVVSGDRLWTISLWLRPTLSELRRGDLHLERQLVLGGSNYHLALDAARRRLWVTSWYGGRVRVVDLDRWETVATLRAGFGARAVALLPDLALVSSGYDGRLHLYDAERLEPLGSMAVGGHVKDLAVDAERGRAWFGSECGIYELDWRGWARSLGAPGGRTRGRSGGR